MPYSFNRHLICPGCKKGEVLADGKAKVTVSVMCPKCKRFFWGDLDTLKTERANHYQVHQPLCPEHAGLLELLQKAERPGHRNHI